MVLALSKRLQIFSPLMGCDSLFGGFVSPFVGFFGFCIWVCFFFFFFFFLFLQKSRWLVVIGGFGYGWIWLEVLGFREILIIGHCSVFCLCFILLCKG